MCVCMCLCVGLCAPVCLKRPGYDQVAVEMEEITSDQRCPS